MASPNEEVIAIEVFTLAIAELWRRLPELPPFVHGDTEHPHVWFLLESGLEQCTCGRIRVGPHAIPYERVKGVWESYLAEPLVAYVRDLAEQGWCPLFRIRDLLWVVDKDCERRQADGLPCECRRYAGDARTLWAIDPDCTRRQDAGLPCRCVRWYGGGWRPGSRLCEWADAHGPRDGFDLCFGGD